MREPDHDDLMVEHDERQERLRRDRLLAHPDCRDPAHPGCSRCRAEPEMLAALRTARAFIHMDRTALADVHTGPTGLDEDGAAAVAEYDEALAQIDAAIASATRSPT